MAYKKSNPNGQATMANSEPVVIASNQTAIPVQLSDGADVVPIWGEGDGGTNKGIVPMVDTGSGGYFNIQGDLNGHLKVVGAVDHDSIDNNFDAPLKLGGMAKSATPTAVINNDRVNAYFDLTGHQMVKVVENALPTGAATSALQTQPGVDIGDVTINNTAGASAVNIQDGGNSITVDAPVGTPAFVRLSDGTAAIATLPVSLATLPALTASTANIGDVDVLTLPALPAGTNNIGDVDVETFESSVDVTLQNAAVATGNGTVLATTGYGVAVVQVTGTFVATITFEATADGTNYHPISATQIGAGLIVTVATTTGIYRMSVSGLTNIRARISAFTSGSVTVLGRTTNAPMPTKAVSLSTSNNNIGDVDVLTVNGVAPAFGTGVRGATVQRVTVATDDLVPVSAASLPLPTGAATSALQTTQDTSINTLLKPASTLTAVTTVATVTNIAQQGGVAISLNTGVRDTGTQRVTIATNDSVPVTGAFFQATQPVSAASLPLPTGASTLAEQQTQTTSLQLIDDAVYTSDGVLGKTLGIAAVFDDVTPVAITENQAGYVRMSSRRALLVEGVSGGTAFPVTLTSTTITGSVAVTGPLTDTQLRATAVPVSGTVAVTGVATETTLAALNTKTATAKTFDLDTGAGTDTVQAVGLAVGASGGSVAITGDAANGLDVDVTRLPALVAGSAVIGALVANQSVNNAQINGVAPLMGNGITGTGSQRVTIASDNTAFAVNATLAAETTKVIGTVNIAAAQTVATVTTVSAVTAITNALPVGANVIGQVSINQTTPGTTNAVQDIPATSGGLSKAHLVSAATTNATNVKASAGQVYAITAFNLNASPRYLKLHNTAAAPTAGAGVTDTFLIPGNTAGAGLVINFDKGITFSTGIGFTLVTGIADTNAVAVAVDEIVLQIYFK